jgi:hypothetical protein
MEFAVAVAWHNAETVGKFLGAWRVPDPVPPWLFLQQDKNREGGAKTKNKAMRRAYDAGAEVIVCLDDDCHPCQHPTLEIHAQEHIDALQPQPVEMFEAVTDPPSRGTPYFSRTVGMPVAASMGFWTEHGDHCAVRQLATSNAPMTFRPQAIHGRYFPLCGMNYAFRRDQHPFFYMLEGVGRFDDIWGGWIWQKHAYARGLCFNLLGPLVTHSRQSNVWANLTDEAQRLERSETLWRDIACSPHTDYDHLAKLALR